ncbi:MAG: hypothetical protein EXQ55_02635 [Acidobacteria bacterium]|nr:hypothetical protein [Acidobacteriota bacterium]
MILGSARGESHALALADAVITGRSATRIDLRDLDIRLDGFEVPFRETAAYLAMDDGGIFYAQTNKQGFLPSAVAGAAAFGDQMCAGPDRR